MLKGLHCKSNEFSSGSLEKELEEEEKRKNRRNKCIVVPILQMGITKTQRFQIRKMPLQNCCNLSRVQDCLLNFEHICTFHVKL